MKALGKGTRKLYLVPLFPQCIEALQRKKSLVLPCRSSGLAMTDRTVKGTGKSRMVEANERDRAM